MPKVVSANPIKLVAATLTRPTESPAVQYTAGDAMANAVTGAAILTLTNAAAENGGSGVIRQADVIDSANQFVKAGIYLYIFDTAPAATNDNAAWAPSDADMTHCLGCIFFSTSYYQITNAGSGADGNCYCSWGGNTYLVKEFPFQCLHDSRNLYLVPVAQNGYVPLSAEVFTFNFLVEQR